MNVEYPIKVRKSTKMLCNMFVLKKVKNEFNRDVVLRVFLP